MVWMRSSCLRGSHRHGLSTLWIFFSIPFSNTLSMIEVVRNREVNSGMQEASGRAVCRFLTWISALAMNILPRPNFKQVTHPPLLMHFENSRCHVLFGRYKGTGEELGWEAGDIGRKGEHVSKVFSEIKGLEGRGNCFWISCGKMQMVRWLSLQNNVPGKVMGAPELETFKLLWIKHWGMEYKEQSQVCCM